MATDAELVTYLCDQIAGAGRIASRKMFGEYALYCDGKVVAFVCDNQLFVKPTDAGRALLGEVVEAPPYPGGKPHFLIADGLDDREGLARLIGVTARALPEAKVKPVKAVKARAKALKSDER